MKQADVPVGFHATQKLDQGARAFRKLKTIELFVYDVCASSNHVSNMQARHVVAGKIRHRKAVILEPGQDYFLFLQSILECNADKQMGV